MELWNEEKQERTYKNAWITDKTITRENVKELVEWGRARWKIENEHNNVLKHRGYNLEHNGEPKVRTGMGKIMPAKYVVC
jgi:hypothetical protein